MQKTIYIPAPDNFKNYLIYQEYPEAFKPLNKFPISKIKIAKRYLSYPNPVRQYDVECIVNDFHIEGWEPIYLNEAGFLLDGQHRLAAAKKMKLKYIDAIIVDESKM